MARTHESRLIVSLLDRVTAPARRVSSALRGLGGDMNRFGQGGGGLGTRLEAAMARNEASLDRARVGIADTVASYYTLKAAIGAPIRAAAAFETALEDIGQKAGVPVEKLGELGGRIKQVARDTNQSASEIAAAVDALVGRGAGLDVALVAANPIGKAATAYRAATDDLAAASWSAVDNLKVPADQIELALDAMAQAGKEGAFELRDMATYFPSLGAAYQGLGQTGVDSVADLAAALQVVRKGTGDASSAATNLQNVLQKVYAPATVKRFGEAGVDIFKEMEAAAARGLTPIEAIAEITDRTLKGDLSRMGNLFEDAQVQAGLRSLIQGMDEYRRIRAEAMAASGVLEADYQRRIKTAAGATKRWQASIELLSITFGESLLPALNDVLDRIIPLVGQIGELVQANPRLVSSLALATGGLVAFRGGLAALRFVGLLGQSGALNLAHLALGRIGGTAASLRNAAMASTALQASLAAMQGATLTRWDRVGAVMRGIAGAVPGVRFAAPAIGTIVGAVAAISAPAWFLIAGAVAAVGAAWKYWDRVSAIASGAGDAIGEALAPALEKLRPILQPLSPILDRAAAGFTAIDNAIRRAAEGARSLLSGLFTREVLTETEQAELRTRASRLTTALLSYFEALPGKLLTVGGEMIQKLWDGMRSRWGELRDWLSSIASQVTGAFSVSDNTVAGYAGSQMGPIDGARAKGGRVSAGATYLVGEEGPEIITPSSSGYVHPNQDGQAASGASPATVDRSVTIQKLNLAISPALNFAGATAADAERIAREVLRKLEAEASAALRGAFADLQVG